MRFTLALAAAAAASAQVPPYNIVQRLQLIPDASTLVTAVVAGGLAGTLSGKGPFTVFAPDNFAFDRLPPGVLPELLKNITLLDEVLTYHVVSGNVSSGQLKDGQKVPTVEGADLLINLHKGPNGQTDVIINQDSRVTYANNYATNGVIHFIDRVLIPRAAMSAGLRAVFEAAEDAELIAKSAAIPNLNLVQLLQLIPQFSTLVTAVVAGGDAATLSGKGPFTIFAPNDFAFDRLPNGVLPALLKNITELNEVLTYHVVAGNVSSSQLTDGEQVPTLNGKDILVNIFADRRDPTKKVVELDHRSQVLSVDNYATNGVFHEIDEVLLPPRLAKKYKVTA